MCQGEPRSIKIVGQGHRPETLMTTWVRVPNAASPNYTNQGEDA